MPGKRTTVPSTCDQCGQVFEARTDKGRRVKFCRRQCYRDSIQVPLTIRFWSKVDKSGPVPEHRPDLGPCWLWTGEIAPNGYGRLDPGDGETRYAHRISYKMHIGHLKPGMDCCHHCDVRHCVRPTHFFEGTRAENVADMVAKGRAWRQGQSYAS